MIDLINREEKCHILTIEDPIEFIHQSKNCLVNQRELGPHTHSFANALRSSLREDPDVILVGEMRDLETISLALTAAETGHLVFGTLHTSSAPKTVDRIIDVFPPGQQEQVRTMFSESLQAVLTQQLLKRKRRERASCGIRNHDRYTGCEKPDPRKQDRSNPIISADREAIWHADHGSGVDRTLSERDGNQGSN